MTRPIRGRHQRALGGHLLAVSFCLFTLALCWAPIAWHAWRASLCDPATVTGWANCRAGW